MNSYAFLRCSCVSTASTGPTDAGFCSYPRTSLQNSWQDSDMDFYRDPWSLRVESHIERGDAVRLERQLPFLDTKNRMPCFYHVGAGRKLTDRK